MMNRRARLACVIIALLLARQSTNLAQAQAKEVAPSSPRNGALLAELKRVHGLSDQSMRRIEEIFATSSRIGQGNEAVTRHPVTPQECSAKLKALDVSYEDAASDRICGARYMAPLYDPSREKREDAKSCIDRFEFPNIPCSYPVVWIKARDAALVCEAEGKRLCDAHEWEGGCAGRLEEPDYDFALARGRPQMAAVEAMRSVHNRKHAATKSWSYGAAYQKGICGASSAKTEGCNGGDWAHCGSNTFPSGFFPACHSSSGVYDVNGNAAEHMNLPLDESQMASRGSKTLGVTEMKGSWFIFDRYQAHEDWCRWRAPFWHGSRVMDKNSHENYHLGFRCCTSLR
jgi:hypothetical protein